MPRSGVTRGAAFFFAPAGARSSDMYVSTHIGAAGVREPRSVRR